MDYPEPSFICDRCSQLCYRPVSVHLDRSASLGPKDLRICWGCFESAIFRSGAVLAANKDGNHSVTFPTQPVVEP